MLLPIGICSSGLPVTPSSCSEVLPIGDDDAIGQLLPSAAPPVRAISPPWKQIRRPQIVKGDDGFGQLAQAKRGEVDRRIAHVVRGSLILDVDDVKVVTLRRVSDPADVAPTPFSAVRQPLCVIAQLHRLLMRPIQTQISSRRTRVLASQNPDFMTEHSKFFRQLLRERANATLHRWKLTRYQTYTHRFTHQVTPSPSLSRLNTPLPLNPTYNLPVRLHTLLAQFTFVTE